MNHEAELLRRYATGYDDDAFREFVRQGIDLVYAIALRQCRGNSALAWEVTQLVFTDVAQRARSLAAHPALLGWLHTATRFAAMKMLRAECRRQRREQRAAELQLLWADESAPIDWLCLQPVLDTALGELKERDRTAILLRFFQGKTWAEIGTSLRMTETAARSSVDRALERLRENLARRGLTSSCAALGLSLGTQASVAAPTGLATMVSAAALGAAPTTTAIVSLFAMKKILIAAFAVVLAAEIATATVELKTKSNLEADFRQLPATSVAPTVSTLAPSPPAPSSANAVAFASARLAEEIDRLGKRVALLTARAPGVTDAQMKAPRPAGRDTMHHAMQTLTAAVGAHDLVTMEQYVRFQDDTKETRELFMGQFSEATRARYPTPERLILAAVFDEVLRDPPVAQQILASHGYAGSGGVQIMTTWTRLASGVERRDDNPFEERADGWGFPTFSLTGKNVYLGDLRARFDPQSGEVLPAKRPAKN